MKQHPTNSRRNFLSAMAILSSGTVLAGSPLNLWNSKRSGTHLKDSWHLLLKNYDAVVCEHHQVNIGQHALQAIPGQFNKQGQMMAFSNQKLMALPTWINWGNSNGQPGDVVITFFEDSYPYKKLKSINRFELQALNQLSCDNNPLRAICNKTAESGKRLNIKTHIASRKTKQHVQLLAGNKIVSTQQLFYNI